MEAYGSFLPGIVALAIIVLKVLNLYGVRLH